MKVPNLTTDEQAHVTNGGRVFIVQEIPGPLWRVLSVSSQGCKVFLKPEGLDGYITREDAEENALMMANLSADTPIVRL